MEDLLGKKAATKEYVRNRKSLSSDGISLLKTHKHFSYTYSKSLLLPNNRVNFLISRSLETRSRNPCTKQQSHDFNLRLHFHPHFSTFPWKKLLMDTSRWMPQLCSFPYLGHSPEKKTLVGIGSIVWKQLSLRLLSSLTEALSIYINRGMAKPALVEDASNKSQLSSTRRGVRSSYTIRIPSIFLWYNYTSSIKAQLWKAFRFIHENMLVSFL